jgi:nucleoside 2-deoxyribosyltransferase
VKRIYIAGPLFSEAEKRYNDEVSNYVKKLGFSTFLPQKDGMELSRLEEMGCSKEEAERAIFNLDISEIEKSDIILFIMDGRVPDEGACVEIGFGYAKGKECIGLKTDARSFMNGCDNPMISGAVKFRIANNLIELSKYLDELVLLDD